MSRRGRAWTLTLSLLVTGAAGCARTVPPPVVVPGAERFPEYPRPMLSPDLARQTRPAARHDLAWLQLQSGDPRAAERTLRELLRTAPSFYPSQAALGFARLAQGQPADALQSFDRSLSGGRAYLPALIGRAEALVELGREGEAFEAYQSVLALDPAHPVAERRVGILRFRAVQSDVSAARAALEGGNLREARDAYDRAIKASPDSGFLHRDLAIVQHRLGDDEHARELVDRALTLDPEDARAYALRAELDAAAGDAEAALGDYRRALALDPGLSEVARRISEIETGLNEAALPVELKAIPQAPRVTRGDLAALLAHRLPVLLQSSARRTVLITDSRRHWAQQAILLATRAGAMEVYPNHTFQPGAGMTRGEFASVTNRVLGLIAVRAPAAARIWQDGHMTFADVRPGHALFVPISRTVASGVLQPLEAQTFGTGRPMSGADAAQAVERLAQLAAQAGLTTVERPGASRP